jgi:hypothetical protein
MKKLALYLILACICVPAAAQIQIGLGGMAAVTTYWGDFNNSRIVANPDLMFGGVLRYSFNDYYNLRINAAGGYLSGDPASFSGTLISQNANQTPAAFRTFFFDLDAKIEFGFLPYNPFGGRGRQRFSPYFALGAGIFYSKNKPHLQLPLALGVKYRIAYRWTLGLEWVVAKTFVDDIDNWENIRSPEASWFLNNDWVTYFGIHLVYQLFDDRVCKDCDH